MLNKPILLLLVTIICLNCKSSKDLISLSPDLKITRLSPNVYVHTSNLDIPNYGKFPCNGMVYTNGKQAYVFDTPTNAAQSKDLIHWLQWQLKVEIVGVVVNHLHLMAIQKLVYLELGLADVLARVIENDSNLSNEAYNRAWGIIEEVGHEAFVAELQ